MAQKIQIKRGTEAQRNSFTPAEGEPIWTTDEKSLFIGDGSTVGGVGDKVAFHIPLSSPELGISGDGEINRFHPPFDFKLESWRVAANTEIEGTSGLWFQIEKDVGYGQIISTGQMNITYFYKDFIELNESYVNIPMNIPIVFTVETPSTDLGGGKGLSVWYIGRRT